MDPVHCLLLWKGSNYSVMIALTWCAQLCKLYSYTQIILSVGSGASELVLGLLYLANPLILSLFCSSLNPGRCVLTFTEYFARRHPRTQTRSDASENTGRAMSGQASVMLAPWAESASCGSRDVLGPGLMLWPGPLLAGQLLCKECWVCVSIIWSKGLHSSHLALIHHRLCHCWENS